MQILNDLYSETKRLFIAGSKFAKNDPRISKYIPVLEKMGEKAPVMKKLAEKYTVLVKEGQPEALADAGTFLYAVMATQGTTEAAGEIAETTPSINELPKTNTPYSRLKPILDALTVSRQGRYEVIKRGFSEGLLNDFRLFEPIVSGLDDKYSELADYIYEKVIPSAGKPVIPYILDQYNPKGKKGDAMRLSLLDKLGYENAGQLAFDAIEEGGQLVAVEGIKILGADPENEEYLLKLAGDKKAAIREAALIGLIRMDSARGKELMMKTLQGSRYKYAVQAAKLCKDPEYTGEILDLIKPYYDKLFEKDLPDKEFCEVNSKFADLFGTLENKDEPAVYEFFTDILSNKDYSRRLNDNKIYYFQSDDVRKLICDHLLKSPADKAVKVFEDAITPEIMKKTPDIAVCYFHIAMKNYTPEHIFDVFSKYYVIGKINFDKMFLTNELSPEEPYDYNKCREAEAERIRSIIDPRWKKAFIQKRDMSAISVLLCNGDEYEQEMKKTVLKQAKECASKKTAGKNLGFAVGRFVETTSKKNPGLFKNDLEKAAEICYEIFEKTDGYAAESFYEGISKVNFLKLFHPEYSDKFRSLTKQKTSYIFRQIAEMLHEADIPQIICQ